MTACLTQQRRSHPMWNPWKALRDLPGVTVFSCRLDGPLGLSHASTGVVILERDQTIAERRVTLTHELIHIERGHDGCQDNKAEGAVEREAAARLIPLDALVSALLWSDDDYELAEELWVDVETVRTRLNNLTEQEHRELSERLWAREWGAA